MKAVRATRRDVLSGMAKLVAGGALGAAAGVRYVMAAATRASDAKKWDVIVVGAGVFGAWTAWKLQKLGKQVLLADAWGPAHARSSSGGESRLIRTEYGSSELYTGMAWESLPEWQALSSRAGLPTFHPCGALYLHADVSDELSASAVLHRKLGIPMERLDRTQLARRFPQIRLAGLTLGVLQPTMGAIMARRAVQMLVEDFVAAGGMYRQVAIQPPTGGGALDSVVGKNGEPLQAEQFVFACGPWLPKLFPDVIGTRIVPTRQDVFFFAPESGDSSFEAQRMPAWVDTSVTELYYGFPVLEARGFKVALDAQGPKFDPDTGERQITGAALAQVREYLARRFPGISGRPLAESRVCQYENTATGDFIIDRHPAIRNAWLIGGGSGHGFKHGPAIGRYVAELLTGRMRKPEAAFSLAGHAQQDSR